MYFERAAALQLAASAAGEIRPVDPEKARVPGRFLLKTPIRECHLCISGTPRPAIVARVCRAQVRIATKISSCGMNPLAALPNLVPGWPCTHRVLTIIDYLNNRVVVALFKMPYPHAFHTLLRRLTLVATRINHEGAVNARLAHFFSS